jgi:hypothetical protein
MEPSCTSAVLIGAGPEVRAVDAAGAVAEAVELLEGVGDALNRPVCYADQAVVL